MPIYEYVCDDCQQAFEVLVRGDQQPRCTACGGERLRKLLSVPAAHTGGSAAELPICEGPSRGPCGMGGCGLPECG
jgi:putative FmdB family regulatory protein